jgi:curved DNA-binding protein CbpA
VACELYAQLEVGPRASHEQIVAAYRRLAHRVHPDAHPDDPEAPRRFREITDAYAVLGDPARRARYDEACRSALRAPVRSARPRPVAPQPFIVDLGPVPAAGQAIPAHLTGGAGVGGTWRPVPTDPFGALTQLLDAVLRDIWSS